MKLRLFFRDLDPKREGRPIEAQVHARAATRRTYRKLADLASSVTEALGDRVDAWLEYERLSNEVHLDREALHFDLGVEHGLEVAHAEELAGSRRAVRDFTQHLLREALASGLQREDAAAAAVATAWSLLGRLRVAGR